MKTNPLFLWVLSNSEPESNTNALESNCATGNRMSRTFMGVPQLIWTTALQVKHITVSRSSHLPVLLGGPFHHQQTPVIKWDSESFYVSIVSILFLKRKTRHWRSRHAHLVENQFFTAELKKPVREEALPRSRCLSKPLCICISYKVQEPSFLTMKRSHCISLAGCHR